IFGGEYQIVMLDPGEGELPSLYFEIGLGAFMFRFEQDQDPMGLPGETCPKKFPSVEAAKAAAQADYEARILSALELSSAREQALEETIALCKDYAEDSQPDSEYRLACNDIIEAIQERRALSSPDHADAGKVEGDGWPTGEYEVDYEVICNGEWVAGSTDLNDAKHYAAVYSQDGKIEIVEARTYRRPLPSAPASEGAE